MNDINLLFTTLKNIIKNLTFIHLSKQNNIDQLIKLILNIKITIT